MLHRAVFALRTEKLANRVVQGRSCRAILDMPSAELRIHDRFCNHRSFEIRLDHQDDQMLRAMSSRDLVAHSELPHRDQRLLRQ